MVRFIMTMAMALALGTQEVPDVQNEPKAEEVAVEILTDIADILNAEGITVDLGTLETTEDSGVEPKMIEKYSRLYEQNTDMTGYIYLSEDIEYPVMFTPYNQNYYIDHDFNKSESREGLPFLNRNSVFGEKGISLMYGHNLKSGRIFSVLKNYLNEDYFNENKYIQADTLFKTQKYEVVAVALTSLNEPFEYYKYVGNISEEDFEEWKEGFKEYCIRGSLSELTCQDIIVELSTCYYHKDDGRLVVILKGI